MLRDLQYSPPRASAENFNSRGRKLHNAACFYIISWLVAMHTLLNLVFVSRPLAKVWGVAPSGPPICIMGSFPLLALLTAAHASTIMLGNIQQARSGSISIQPCR